MKDHKQKKSYVDYDCASNEKTILLLVCGNINEYLMIW